MALYVNGKKVVNSLVIDGEAFYKATLFDGTVSTDKWAEPIVFSTENALDYETICFKGTDQGTSFTLYYTIADLPISADPVVDNDYTQFSTNGYLYLDANGVLYFCVTTGKTLVLNEVLLYGGKEKESQELTITELCCFNGQAGTNVEIAWLGSLAKYNDYSSYLNYNTSTRKFEVLKDFVAILSGWVHSWDRSSSTYSEGRTYINSSSVLSYQVDALYNGLNEGKMGIFQLRQGDTIYAYTPSRNGYPQQFLKIYRLNPPFEIPSATTTASKKTNTWSDEGASS